LTYGGESSLGEAIGKGLRAFRKGQRGEDEDEEEKGGSLQPRESRGDKTKEPSALGTAGPQHNGDQPGAE